MGVSENDSDKKGRVPKEGTYDGTIRVQIGDGHLAKNLIVVHSTTNERLEVLLRPEEASMAQIAIIVKDLVSNVPREQRGDDLMGAFGLVHQNALSSLYQPVIREEHQYGK